MIWCGGTDQRNRAVTSNWNNLNSSLKVYKPFVCSANDYQGELQWSCPFKTQAVTKVFYKHFRNLTIVFHFRKGIFLSTVFSCR